MQNVYGQVLPTAGRKGYMDIGTSDKPHVHVMEQEGGSRLLIEDTEMMTYTLYEVIETVMHPKPRTADKYAEMPYSFDALTGVMRIYRLVGTEPSTEAGIDKLLGEATKV
jgi:hypothetical protein